MSDEISFSFFNLIFFKWRIIALQYCVGFCHILTWISHRSICPLPPETLLPSPCSSCPSPLAMRETLVWFLGGEDPLEKSMAAHSRVLAWRIPWAEGPGGLPQGVVKSRVWLSDSAQHSTSVHTWFQHSRASVSAEPLGQLSVLILRGHFIQYKPYSPPDFQLLLEDTLLFPTCDHIFHQSPCQPSEYSPQCWIQATDHSSPALHHRHSEETPLWS